MDILGPVDWHGVNGKYAITDYGEAVAPSRVGKDVKRFYILLVVCACTGFLVCHVIDDKQAKTIQSALSSTFSLFDTPSLICSDQESSFKAKELVAWYQTLGAEFRYSATYNPKTNGLVERRVGIVKSIMQRLIADNTFKFENWEESVRAIQFYINSRLDRDSGYSPFMLMFGRFPAGADGRARQMKLNENFDFTEWTKLQNFVMLEAIPYHAAAKRARRRKYLEFHDVSRNVEQEALEIDQPVYLRNTIKKFGDAKWHGPFFVCWVRYNSNNKPSVYKLRGAGKTTGGILRGLYPRDQLKVIPNDSYAREIDDDTRHIEAIYHFHRGKKGIGCHYLIKYLDDNNPTWIHESLLNDNFMNDYHELRSKRNEKLIEKGKSISTPFPSNVQSMSNCTPSSITDSTSFVPTKTKTTILSRNRPLLKTRTSLVPFATFWISSLGPRATPTTNQLELILSNTASPQPPHPRTYTSRPRTSDSCTVHSRFANILPRHAKTQLYSIISVHSNSLPPLSLSSLSFPARAFCCISSGEPSQSHLDSPTPTWFLSSHSSSRPQSLQLENEGTISTAVCDPFHSLFINHYLPLFVSLLSHYPPRNIGPCLHSMPVLCGQSHSFFPTDFVMPSSVSPSIEHTGPLGGCRFSWLLYFHHFTLSFWNGQFPYKTHQILPMSFDIRP
jgi:transposase InsO family protein